MRIHGKSIPFLKLLYFYINYKVLVLPSALLIFSAFCTMLINPNSKLLIMKKRMLGVDPGVVLLGIVSFLTDISSEMIFSVFSMFFTLFAGASSALLGVVEGLADFSSSSLDYLSGWLSDRTGKRKPLALLGYCFSTLAKISLLFSNSVAVLSGFRVVERLGKSFRGPPRDAWISSIASKETRGYAFGLHKAFDKSGAVLGPLLAYVLLSWLGQNIATFRVMFWIAVVFAALSVVVLMFVKEKKGVPREKQNLFTAWKTLSSGFKRYLVAAGIFSLAYFSFSFLLLRAYQLGFSVKDVVLLYALFNISFVFVAAPIGKLGDRIGRSKIVVLGYLVYLLMCLGFVFAVGKPSVVALFILFGIFYAIDEAQSKAFISDIEKNRRATAIGAYNFVTGLVYVPASIIAGALWAVNSSYAFFFAAGITLFAMLVFIALRPASR
jgi:MFS family permease